MADHRPGQGHLVLDRGELPADRGELPADRGEQCIDWLKNCNMNHSLSYDGEYRSDRYLVINAFREAMRPATTTTTKEDN